MKYIPRRQNTRWDFGCTSIVCSRLSFGVATSSVSSSVVWCYAIVNGISLVHEVRILNSCKTTDKASRTHVTYVPSPTQKSEVKLMHMGIYMQGSP